jgi:amino acid transporter
MDHDKENIRTEKSASDITPPTGKYYHEDLNEPPKEESLHRSLKARQISMIAVCISMSQF